MNYRDKTKKGRKRRIGFMLLGVGGVALALFLPGPNGIVRVWSKHRRAGHLTKQIEHLAFQIDSLDACRRCLADPAAARELARRTFGSIQPASDTANPESQN